VSKHHTNRLLGGILLITGTCIGAGMLALPVSTATYGFWPSTGLFVICWAFMMFSALLILEVTLWSAPESNLISMAKSTLGKGGEILAWTAYLLLLYCLMAAYLSGMNALISEALAQLFHFHLPQWGSSSLLIILFGLIIYSGEKPIDYLNRLLITGLIISYVAIIFFISPHIETTKLLTANTHHLWIALPIIIVSFGYHIIIPSLRTYLKNDVKQLRLAIIIGSCLPLAIYLLWEMLILGVVPTTGEHGLLTILKGGQPSTDLTNALHAIVKSPWLDEASTFLSFFVISTSFIGVSYSLFDFLADGFHIAKNKLGRASTAMVTFIPPLIFILAYPQGFILALGYGSIFVAVLLCLLPALMVYSGRYVKKMATGYRVCGGKLALFLLIIFSIVVIIAEFMNGYH